MISKSKPSGAKVIQSTFRDWALYTLNSAIALNAAIPLNGYFAYGGLPMGGLAVAFSQKPTSGEIASSQPNNSFVLIQKPQYGKIINQRPTE